MYGSVWFYGSNTMLHMVQTRATLGLQRVGTFRAIHHIWPATHTLPKLFVLAVQRKKTQNKKCNIM